MSRLDVGPGTDPAEDDRSGLAEPGGPELAIIGMAGRFPGAPSVEALWELLVRGDEGISRFSEEELLAEGLPPELIRHPAYVPARGVIDDALLFDAGYFGMSATEARVTDPQHRLFLEVATEALEEAAIDPSRVHGAIGVMGGADVNSYALGQLLVWTHDLQSLLGNDKDYLATRVAFKLDLRGPAITVQTACSTSLVAVAVAAQSLLSYQCDVALAGGVGLAFPQRQGHVFQEGGILSPDGRCRSFDADGQGTVGADGCGVVVLKRLADALADGDPIRAVIRGIALNNDGAAKIGFTAPSAQGQAEVIAMAQAMAGVSPEDIGYVECHGTATQLGDPIELAALDQVFQAGTERRGFCPIGSVKSNLGHMNSAAGVGGLIKAALCLERATIPPSLHLRRPNPRIDWEGSCFFVNEQVRPWPAGPLPRRAAVSSFGVGGTNAHAVLEEAPPRPEGDPAQDPELLLLSAMDGVALGQLEERICAWLLANPEANLGEVAWTHQLGRRRLAVGKAVAISSAARVREALASAPALPVARPGSGRVAFLLPGQGAQHPGMMVDLHRREPAFREAFARCRDGLAGAFGEDPLALLEQAPAERLARTELTQPLLFALELSLARLYEARGIRPVALLGHSVGELVAACLAGVFSTEDGLQLVLARGRLVAAAPPGAMLAVSRSEAEALALAAQVDPELELAAVNGPEQSVLAGTHEQIGRLSDLLSEQGIGHQRLRTSHAFHSRLLDGVLPDYRQVLQRIRLSPPEIPMLSGVSGDWLRPEEATSPEYWVRQLRRPVRFGPGLARLLEDPELVLCEPGPGTSLGNLARRHPDIGGRAVIQGARPRADGPGRGDREVFVEALGRLALAGIEPDWEALHGGPRQRLRLPTYPFQRQRYWQGLGVQGAIGDTGSGLAGALKRASRPEQMLYSPAWLRQRAPGSSAAEPLRVIHDGDPLGRSLGEEHGQAIALADLPLDLAGWVGDPDAHLVLATLLAPADAPRRLQGGAHLLLRLLRAGARRITVLGRGLCEVEGVEPTSDEPVEGTVSPEGACLRGLVQVLAQEPGTARVRVVDVGLHPTSRALRAELLAGPDAPAFVALSGGWRYLPTPVPLREVAAVDPLPQGAIVLITGGLGQVGLALGLHLARRYRARLVLSSRVGLLARAEWEGWLATHAPNDPTSQRIRAIQQIEEAGGQVLAVAADVADPEALEQLQRRIAPHWGAFDAVVHAAGLAGHAAFRALADTGPEQLDGHLRAKLGGGRVLLAGLPPGTRIVFLSSISTVLGGVGLGAYSAANHAIEALALSSQGRAQAIAYDAWGKNALSATEGGALLDLALGLPQVPVILSSTVDLAARLVQVEQEGRRQLDLRNGPGAGTPIAGTRHPRPELKTPYLAPRNPTETQLAQLWAELFSLEEVGVQDSFFELGGDSLLAIQLGARLKERLGVEIPINELFEQPTIESLARTVLVRRAGAAALDDPLSLVERLSDDEVRAMLAALDAGTAPEDKRLVPERYHFEPGGPVDRGEVRRFYDSVSSQLDASPYRDHALFLNYGYLPNEAPSFSAVPLPAQLPGRNPIRLVCELVGDQQLAPHDRVLDVGCGRGGTVAVLRRYFQVGEITGLDLSPVAVAFCQRRHGDERTRFVQGDAHALPLADRSVDVVTNVESSHCYGELPPFFAEVARVLRPGGVFLYTDVLAASRLDEAVVAMEASGLHIEHRRDITANVLLSCDETSRMNARAFQAGNDEEMLERFLAVPDSALYQAMKAGEQRYVILRARRR